MVNLSGYSSADSMATLGEGLSATLVLNAEEAKAGGSAGCNNFFGAYRINGDSLLMPGPFGVTMKMCPDPQMALEKTYLGLLETSETFGINGRTLIINCADNKILAFSSVK